MDPFVGGLFMYFMGDPLVKGREERDILARVGEGASGSLFDTGYGSPGIPESPDWTTPPLNSVVGDLSGETRAPVDVTFTAPRGGPDVTVGLDGTDIVIQQEETSETMGGAGAAEGTRSAGTSRESTSATVTAQGGEGGSSQASATQGPEYDPDNLAATAANLALSGRTPARAKAPEFDPDNLAATAENLTFSGPTPARAKAPEFDPDNLAATAENLAFSGRTPAATQPTESRGCLSTLLWTVIAIVVLGGLFGGLAGAGVFSGSSTPKSGNSTPNSASSPSHSQSAAGGASTAGGGTATEDSICFSSQPPTQGPTSPGAGQGSSSGASSQSQYVFVETKFATNLPNNNIVAVRYESVGTSGNTQVWGGTGQAMNGSVTATVAIPPGTVVRSVSALGNANTSNPTPIDLSALSRYFPFAVSVPKGCLD